MNNKLLVGCFLIFLQLQNAHAEDLASLRMPEFEIMRGMKTEWVADKMIYNGHPMTIQNFSANRSSEDVMRHFASRWKVKGHGELKPRRMGDQMTIGYEHNGYSYSVSHETYRAAVKVPWWLRVTRSSSKGVRPPRP